MEPDYLSLSTGQLHAAIGTDATKWAAAFAQYVRAKPEIATDPDAMAAWFAGALMAGHDHAAREAAHIRKALDAIDTAGDKFRPEPSDYFRFVTKTIVAARSSAQRPALLSDEAPSS